MSTIQLAPPRLLKIDIVGLIPLEMFGEFPFPEQPWRFQATVNITPHIHSDLRTPRPGIYNGLDVEVGDYVTTQSSKILKITSLVEQTEDHIVCVIEDEYRLNSSVDPNQSGESAVETGAGILFTAPNGIPVVYPLPGYLEGLTEQDLIEIQSRFFYKNSIAYGSPFLLDIDGGFY